MNETELSNAIRAAMNAIPGVRLWRNNVGVDTQRGVRYGLAVGSADLIGMVDGRFLAVEVKAANGRMSDDQRIWRDVVRGLGGVYILARSVDEAVAAVIQERQ